MLLLKRPQNSTPFTHPRITSKGQSHGFRAPYGAEPALAVDAYYYQLQKLNLRFFKGILKVRDS